MKSVILGLVVILITGCGSSVDGTYARLDRQGEIRLRDGKPAMTITLDEGKAIWNTPPDIPEIGTYEMFESSVIVTVPSMTVQFQIEEGDLVHSSLSKKDIFQKQ